MKWLFLVLLISCGQNKMPKEVDLNDNDGDQIPNHMEVEENKNIADFTPVSKITGEMIFLVGDLVKKEVVYKISNQKDLLTESLDTLTRSESKIIPEDFFSEWSKITVETPNVLPDLADRLTDINLIFLPTASSPDYVLLIKGDENIKLGDFSLNMNFKLTKKNLELILKKEAHLAFGKKTMVQNYTDSQPVQQTIREKTYRVFYNDGEIAKILYVAKDYSFKNFLDSRGLNQVVNMKDINPFQHSQSQAIWYYRDLPNGDKVLVYTAQEMMFDSFLKNYKKTDFTLQRINGSTANKLSISKNINSLVQFKIRPTQTKRTFKEFNEKVKHMIGGGREGSPSKWTCINFYRAIDTEFIIQTSMDDILSQLIFSFNGVTTPLAGVDHSISMKEDEIGQYLLITFPNLPAALDVYLQGNPNETYVPTGQYDLQCDKGEPVRGLISVVPTNVEGYLNLALEAYVEKLD